MTIAAKNMNRISKVKVYFLTRTLMQKFILFIDACFQGFWLGVLRPETLHLVDQFYYDNSKEFKDAPYLSKKYNQRGLWEWERQVVETYFQECQRLIVLGAGGGREVVALCQMGYETDGFECNPNLAEFANQLVQEMDLNGSVQYVPRDQCPAISQPYDGVIVGWGAYMLIQGRHRRIQLLKQLRAMVSEGSPILLSFFYRNYMRRRYFKAVAAIANVFRRLLWQDLVEPGDVLSPNYVHHFTKEEILSELEEAGFTLEMYATNDYGHAVGIAI